MSIKRQGGSVLVVALVLLLVLTILGISGIENTIMEEKMSGNLYQRNQAFQAAEAALRDAEDQLFALDKDSKITPNGSGTSGIWVLDTPATALNGVSASSAWYSLWSVEDNWQTGSCDASITSGCASGVFQSDETTLNSYFVIEYDRRECDSLSVGQQIDQKSCLDYYKVTALGLGPGDVSKVYLRSKIARRY